MPGPLSNPFVRYAAAYHRKRLYRLIGDPGEPYRYGWRHFADGNLSIFATVEECCEDLCRSLGLTSGELPKVSDSVPLDLEFKRT